MHLQGTARKWFQVYIVGKNSLEWLEFCKQFTARFGSWEQELLYNKFKQLHQATTVDLYFDEFEKCKEQLRGRMPELTEEYFVESFIGGLQDQIRDTVRMLAPSSIDQAYRQAKQYVASGKTAREETKETKLTGQAGGSDRSAKLANIQEITSRNSRLSNVIRLTSQEADRRIKEGFCPYCMDKDGINHHCTQPCLFMLKKEENEEGLETLGSGQRCVREKSDMEVEDNEQMEVSVHAIEGLHHNKTITLTGRRGKHQFSILIDGGSTHSFLDEHTAGKLKCELVQTQPLKVQVANGNQLESQYESAGFTWKVGKHEFTFPVRTLPRGSYDLVLGVDWLGSLGLVTFDYKRLILQFLYKGQEVVLQGNSQPLKPRIQQMTAKAFVRSCQRQGHGFLYMINEVCQAPGLLHSAQGLSADGSAENEELPNLLLEYEDIFKAPT
nr:PREDICTED: uncharacterized protein LOC108202460 [Daucus carota subsp. sativus]